MGAEARFLLLVLRFLSATLFPRAYLPATDLSPNRISNTSNHCTSFSADTHRNKCRSSSHLKSVHYNNIICMNQYLDNQIHPRNSYNVYLAALTPCHRPQRQNCHTLTTKRSMTMPITPISSSNQFADFGVLFVDGFPLYCST